jgi:small subunit ribosomal protein S27Ae
MASLAGSSGKDREGKKPHKNKPTSQKWKHYDSNGKKKGKTCPRCGPATFLADRKDRLHCGKCAFTEFVKK